MLAISLAESCIKSHAQAHHVFGLLRQQCRAAGAILLDDVLLDKSHAGFFGKLYS